MRPGGPGQGPLVSRPDFSRQLLSFAQLAGEEVIDLPRSDAADGAAYQTCAQGRSHMGAGRHRD